ncbi:MAG: clan AA aspartic protease [Candidatus Competibacteraceae bacterium]|nr:clan AA aspartic protease [Candidatus Competibacteraceae bacterium]
MNIRLRGGLPFVEVTLDHQGQRLVLPDVLLDTGSAGSLLSADELLKINVCLEPLDPLRRIRGVGGSEFVFIKTLDRLTAGALSASAFAVEVGALDYGFSLQGILGMDFLRHTKALINLDALTLT